MKRFAIAVTLGLALYSTCAFSEPLSDEETTKVAIIKAGKFGVFGGQIVSIDRRTFTIYDENIQATRPGRNEVVIGRFPLSNTSLVVCNTEAGHTYIANDDSCVDLGISEGAARFFAAEKKKKEDALQAKYAVYKDLLQTPQSYATLKEISSYFSQPGIFKQDPDNLASIVDAQMEPHQELEKKQRAEEAVQRAKAEALRAKEIAAADAIRRKEEAARAAEEKKQIASFRKSLAEGDESNCGLVIETKGKLVKVAFAVANYGNEHWIKRDEIFPDGYGCRFVNGQYMSPL